MGRNTASMSTPSRFSGFEKGIYSGLGVIRDGQLLTSSSCPFITVEYGPRMKDYTAQFAAAFVEALGQ